MRITLKLSLLSLLLIGCSTVKQMDGNTENGAYFEGVVTYKHTAVKPAGMSDEDWQVRLKDIVGDQGYVLQKNYYKLNRFAAEVNSGLEEGRQVYNPVDGLHYGWQLGSDIAYTEDRSQQALVSIKDIMELDTSATINDILCKAIKVNYTFGNAVVWYNPEVLKFSGKAYKGTLFESEIIDRIKCLPIKVEIADMLVMEMVEFRQEKIAEDYFNIPEFREVVNNPSY